MKSQDSFALESYWDPRLESKLVREQMHKIAQFYIQGFWIQDRHVICSTD